MVATNCLVLSLEGVENEVVVFCKAIPWVHAKTLTSHVCPRPLELPRDYRKLLVRYDSRIARTVTKAMA